VNLDTIVVWLNHDLGWCNKDTTHMATWRAFIQDNILTSWIVFLLLEKDGKERYKLAFSKVSKINPWIGLFLEKG